MIEENLRKCGIEVIGSVPWGTHFCQFYRTRQDLIDILVPYFKTGIENNEFCMWITAEPLRTEDACAVLRHAVPDLDRYLMKGQIEIIPHTKWYLLGGKFDDERVLNGWVSKMEQALKRGYSGLRLTGNTFWLESNGWQAFTDYEAKVNNVIGKYRMLAICTYCLDKCDGAAVVDVVKNHQFALIKEKGKWDIIEGSVYKQAKEALHEAEEQLRLALNSADLGTFNYDLKAGIVHWDERTKQMYGISGDHDLTYEEAAEFLHPADRRHVETVLARASAPDADGSYEVEFRIIRPDSSVIWNHAIGKVFFEGVGSNRKAVRQTGVNQNITERKKAEEELMRANAELEASNQELEAFSYSVSHDLRAPLRSMEGFSNALLEDYGEKLDEQGKQYLKYVQESGDLMGKLIDDLLKLSRVTRSKISYETINLSELARNIMTAYERCEPNRSVVLNIPPDISAHGDRNLLRLVLENLLGNAWKFTAKTASPKIDMGVIENNGKWAYFVRDNGVGFDMAYADKLFKPFQRLHKETEFAGTGIGLATVQRIIRRHGGKVWSESKVGEGAAFYFTLG